MKRQHRAAARHIPTRSAVCAFVRLWQDFGEIPIGSPAPGSNRYCTPQHYFGCGPLSFNAADNAATGPMQALYYDSKDRGSLPSLPLPSPDMQAFLKGDFAAYRAPFVNSEPFRGMWPQMQQSEPDPWDCRLPTGQQPLIDQDKATSEKTRSDVEELARDEKGRKVLLWLLAFAPNSQCGIEIQRALSKEPTMFRCRDCGSINPASKCHGFRNSTMVACGEPDCRGKCDLWP